MVPRITKKGNTMKNSNIITITEVFFDLVSGKHFAVHDKGNLEISAHEYHEMKAGIAENGKFEILKRIPLTDTRPLSEILASAI